jgi:hypothetical protein
MLCIVLVICYLFAGIQLLWFLIVFSGWGAVVMVHYFALFGIPFYKSVRKKWETEQFEKEITRKESTSNELDEKLELKELWKNYRDEDFV